MLKEIFVSNENQPPDEEFLIFLEVCFFCFFLYATYPYKYLLYFQRVPSNEDKSKRSFGLFRSKPKESKKVWNQYLEKKKERNGSSSVFPGSAVNFTINSWNFSLFFLTSPPRNLRFSSHFCSNPACIFLLSFFRNVISNSNKRGFLIHLQDDPIPDTPRITIHFLPYPWNFNWLPPEGGGRVVFFWKSPIFEWLKW